MLNLLDKEDRLDMAKFILSFQNRNVEIFDSLVQRRSIISRYFHALRYGDINNLTGRQHILSLWHVPLNYFLKWFYAH